MLFNGGTDEIKVLAESTMGAFLILAGEAAVVSYVCIEDGGETQSGS